MKANPCKGCASRNGCNHLGNPKNYLEDGRCVFYSTEEIDYGWIRVRDNLPERTGFEFWVADRSGWVGKAFYLAHLKGFFDSADRRLFGITHWKEKESKPDPPRRC